VADVGFQLARDGRGAEGGGPGAGYCRLALQDPDDGAVDPAGRGDLPEQFGVLPGTGDRDTARP